MSTDEQAFTLPLDRFDIDLLPLDARTPGTSAFREAAKSHGTERPGASSSGDALMTRFIRTQRVYCSPVACSSSRALRGAPIFGSVGEAFGHSGSELVGFDTAASCSRQSSGRLQIRQINHQA